LETFAALLAARQAVWAKDRRLGDAMARIARDEARHAALSWRVAAWIAPQLTARARSRVAREQRAALQKLRAGFVGATTHVAFGLPGEAEATALLDGLRELWSPVTRSTHRPRPRPRKAGPRASRRAGKTASTCRS